MLLRGSVRRRATYRIPSGGLVGSFVLIIRLCGSNPREKVRRFGPGHDQKQIKGDAGQTN